MTTVPLSGLSSDVPLARRVTASCCGMLEATGKRNSSLSDEVRMLRVTVDDPVENCGMAMEPKPERGKGSSRSSCGSVMVMLKFPLWKVAVSCCPDVACLFLLARLVWSVRGKFLTNRSTPFRKLGNRGKVERGRWERGRRERGEQEGVEGRKGKRSAWLYCLHQTQTSFAYLLVIEIPWSMASPISSVPSFARVSITSTTSSATVLSPYSVQRA